jgi:uncharacterized protein (DUF885 family)
MSKNAEHLKVQLEAIRSMFDEMGGVSKILSDFMIVHEWIKRLDILQAKMASIESYYKTVELKYLDDRDNMWSKQVSRINDLEMKTNVAVKPAEWSTQVARISTLEKKMNDIGNMQEQITQIASNFSVLQQAVEAKIAKIYVPDNNEKINERIEGLRALLSGDIVNVRTEISKAVFPVRNLAEESHACLQKQIRGLQKEIEVLKLATTPQKNRKNSK